MKSHDLHTGKKSWKYDLDENDPHIPNKEEAKLLRKLMSETGNTEEEIRAIPKYKRMLAEAQRSAEEGETKWWGDREYEGFLKSIRSKTGFPDQHPLNKLEFNKKVKRSTIFRFGYYGRNNTQKKHFTKKDIQYFEENDIEYKEHM